MRGQRLVGDIIHGYKMMDEDEAIKTQMICDTIGQYLGRPTNRTRYDQKGGNYFMIKNPFLTIKNVIFNDPATIVYWEDGSKTVVKAVDEVFDPEKGLAMAYAKKALGNKGAYYNQFKKWTKKYETDSRKGEFHE